MKIDQVFVKRRYSPEKGLSNNRLKILVKALKPCYVVFLLVNQPFSVIEQ
ncbi:hypothetical protein [Anabaena sp. CCY 9910]